MRKSNVCIIGFPTSLATYVIVWTVWIFGPVSLLRVWADDTSLPSWRQGISTWNGSGYDLPAKQSKSMNVDFDVDSRLTFPGPAQAGSVEDGPVQIRPPVSTDAPPYVVPIDPTTPRANPYFELSEKDDDAPLKMSVPYADPDSALAITIAPPENGAEQEFQSPIRISVPSPTPAADMAAEPEELTTPSFAAESPWPTPIMGEEELPLLGTVDAAETPGSDTVVEPVQESADQDAVADVVDAEMGIEIAPLQDEVIRWYQYPRKWMRGWDSHAEFGLDGSDGNANTLAIQTGFELRRKSQLHGFVVDVDYRQVRSRNETTEDNGRLNIDYDRLLKDTAWSAFGKFGLEYDEFKAFDLRLNVNGGVGYYWVRRDEANLVTRFGAGASREIGAPVDDWIAEAVFGIDADRQLNSRNKVRAKVDYFPAWEDFGDYRLVADFAWEILLDDTDNLSLKLAATDRYDSTPQGAKPNDVYYSLLLLYKF